MLAGVNCLAGDLILGLFKRSSDFSGRRICEETTKNNNKKMAYEVIMVYHLHMPLYFLGIFAEYLYFVLMVLICYCHHQKDTFF